MENWYTKKKGTTTAQGPFSIHQIKKYIQEHLLQSHDLLSCDQKNWQEVHSFFASKQFGDYTIIKELGRGAMGVVYKAHHTSLNRYCALKILIKANEKSQKQFIQEAKAMAKLDHPHIVSIYDTGTSPKHFFAMELIDGETLETWMQKKQTIKKRLKVFQQICLAVEFAHKNKIVHRDLKPENIMINGTNIKVMDFGIARQLDTQNTFYQTGEIIGTPHYIAPEILSGFKADERSDLYALGVILYKMFTGRTPFEEESALQLLYLISTSEPPTLSSFSPKINKDIEVVCMHCIQRKNQARYQKVSLLRREIERIINNQTIITRPPHVLKKISLWCYHHPLPVTLLFILFFVTPLLTILFLYNENLSKNELAKALDNGRASLIKAHFETAKANIVIKNYPQALNNIKNAHVIIQKLPQKDYSQQLSFYLHTVLPNTPVLEKEYRFVKFRKAIVSQNKKYFAGIVYKDKPIFVCGKFSPNKNAYHFDENFFTTPCQSEYVLFHNSQRAYFVKNFTISAYDFSLKKALTFFPVTGHISEIACSPDNKWLAITEGRKVKIHSFEKNNRQTIIEHAQGNICFSKDSSLLAACVRGGISIWDIQKQKEKHSLSYNRNKFTSLTFSHENRYLTASDSFGQLFVYDLARKRETIIGQHINNIKDIKLSNDGRIMASIGQDKRAMLWDTTKRLISMIELQYIPFSLFFENNNLWIHSLYKKDVIVQKWNTANYFSKKLLANQEFQELFFNAKKSHNFEINATFSQPLIVSPRGNFVVQPFLIGSFIWNKQDKFFLLREFRARNIGTLHFSYNEKILANAQEKQIVLLNMDSLKIQQTIKLNNTINSLEFSHDDKNIIVSSGKQIFVCNIDRRNRTTIDLENSYAAPSPKGNLLAIGTQKGDIRIYDKEFLKGKLNNGFHFRTHKGKITAIKWHPSEKYFAVVYANNTISFFRQNSKWTKWKDIEFTQDIKKMSFKPSSDATYFAVFSRKDIVIFDLINDFSGKIYDGYFKGHSADIFSDWSKIAIPSTNGNVLIFKVPQDIYSVIK
ncbi:WD40 repeat domain-containing serine/threonine-protein kinase [Candidatus Uabimicrobium sp. HlEnr_7]|uniref:WD40 repeat domain-containing serine/threonine-protein kinase n=1 Tax=Candidatus Uabimicrobium helgolandensis TaxID=3095367 RepID=UPI0035570573